MRLLRDLLIVITRGRFPSDQSLLAFVVFLAILLVCLGALSGCATWPPCRCTCAPAADPRVADLLHEVNRLGAEAQRLRDRIDEQKRIDEAAKDGPAFELPRFLPEVER